MTAAVAQCWPLPAPGPGGGLVVGPAGASSAAAAGHNAPALHKPPPPCERPLSALLAKLSSFKALAIEASLANATLAPAVLALLGSPLAAALAPSPGEGASGLGDVLHKFGWSPLHGFTRTVDLPGLKAALQKLKYIKLKQLGSGSYGVVHKALNRETAELVAIKKLRHAPEDGLSDSTVREITTLRDLQHQNIVSLIDIISTVNGAHVYLVLECLDCDLRSYLDHHPEASGIPRIKSVVHQLLAGVRHAHANSVMHRDLKPQNVLVDVRSGQIKITDFGLARAFLPCDRAYSEKVVTLYYRAPELLLGAPYYGTAIDMWSVGCILAELVNFEPLFKSDTEIGLLYRIFEQLGTPTLEQWHDLPGLAHFSEQFPKWQAKPMSQLVPRLASDELGLDLLSRLLTLDPARRLSASQALLHPWFRDVACPQPGWA